MKLHRARQRFTAPQRCNARYQRCYWSQALAMAPRYRRVGTSADPKPDGGGRTAATAGIGSSGVLSLSISALPMSHTIVPLLGIAQGPACR